METIEHNYLNHPPYRFVIKAISIAKFKPEDHEKIFNHKPITVEFKINGVDVPFKQSIEELWKVMEENINYLAAEKMKEKLMLNKLSESIGRLESEIIEKIEKEFDVKFDDY